MSEKIYDTVMVGAGPSALAAAVYTTREDIETVLYEKGVIGGLAAITDKVDNYPGFPDGIEGLTLAGHLEKQAERFGAQIEFGQVESIRSDGDIKTLVIDGQDVKARSVLIATGSDYNKLGIPGEAEYYGRGVHYCATCDGAFYREKKLVVVGGGNSAVQEAIFLTRFTTHIDLLVRSTIKASDVLQQELQKFVDDGKITVHLATTPNEIIVTDGTFEKVTATKDGEATEFNADGVFIFVGLKPNTEFLGGSGVELDEQGLIKTDIHLETSVKGIFASGDVRSGATMQIASAVGEGATAALAIREYLDSMPHTEAAPALEAVL
ncbi:FAD-dependent oxidoreductase [Candidatus Saccharibacteria bacterium]|nr:FAD-dependent oxidoreductase [Candidatus Saccharibacteria bacterium]